jgi:hypothetical protein
VIHLRHRTRLAAVGTVLVAIVTVSGPVPPPTAVAQTDAATIDEPLEDAVASAPSNSSLISLEIVTSDTAGAAREVRSIGGAVTGSVPGEVLQAVVAAERVESVDAPADAFLRLPRRVNRPVAQTRRSNPTSREAVTSGAAQAAVGQGVTISNAAEWHAAGLRGAVKVGIIDFFDLGLWDPTEHGRPPDAAHVFCRDTSGRSPTFCPMRSDGVNDGDGAEHGVAVAEIVKDMAPDAELFLATAATTSDMRAAIDWFAANGVSILNRSLGAPYDGPGDGTGPLAALVDHAAALGITWFNSAGNAAAGRYGRYTGGVAPDDYVDFDNGPGVDTTLTITGMCIDFDGIRWNDWGKPVGAVTDYRVELFDPARGALSPPQSDQIGGAPPLELAETQFCVDSGQLALRLRRIATGRDPAPDVVEIAIASGRLEPGRSQVEHSAAKSVVDSRNPALVAVGAIDPATSAAPASYSSQGPTNDGRVKPDVAAPSCLTSSIYRLAFYGPGACFNGTSAASPVAAGVAALLLGRGLATPGAALAALTRHLAVDVGPPGSDNLSGAGLLRLPHAPPVAVDARPAQYVALDIPQRLLDTRSASLSFGATAGPFSPFTIVDVPVPREPATSATATGAGPVTAVAVTIVSVDAPTASWVQAVPTLMAQLGGSANLNVPRPGRITPNFAIVPVGANGEISLFLASGGNVIVDLMGVFAVAPEGGATAGRLVPEEARRVLDTRPDSGGPFPTAVAAQARREHDGWSRGPAGRRLLGGRQHHGDRSGHPRVPPCRRDGHDRLDGGFDGERELRAGHVVRDDQHRARRAGRDDRDPHEREHPPRRRPARLVHRHRRTSGIRTLRAAPSESRLRQQEQPRRCTPRRRHHHPHPRCRHDKVDSGQRARRVGEPRRRRGRRRGVRHAAPVRHGAARHVEPQPACVDADLERHAAADRVGRQRGCLREPLHACHHRRERLLHKERLNSAGLDGRRTAPPPSGLGAIQWRGCDRTAWRARNVT